MGGQERDPLGPGYRRADGGTGGYARSRNSVSPARRSAAAALALALFPAVRQAIGTGSGRPSEAWRISAPGGTAAPHVGRGAGRISPSATSGGEPDADFAHRRREVQGRTERAAGIRSGAASNRRCVDGGTRYRLSR